MLQKCGNKHSRTGQDHIPRTIHRIVHSKQRKPFEQKASTELVQYDQLVRDIRHLQLLLELDRLSIGSGLT